VKQLKQVLVEHYIGAILIALLLNRAIDDLLTILNLPLVNMILERVKSPLIPRSALPPQLGMGILGVVFYGAFAGLLLKWLYFPSQPKMIDGAEDGDGQETDAQ